MGRVTFLNFEQRRFTRLYLGCYMWDIRIPMRFRSVEFCGCNLFRFMSNDAYGLGGRGFETSWGVAHKVFTLLNEKRVVSE